MIEKTLMQRVYEMWASGKLSEEDKEKILKLLEGLELYKYNRIQYPPEENTVAS